MASFLDKTGVAYLWVRIKTMLAQKVDAEAGKGLSTNDYTDDDKAIVDALSDRGLSVVDGLLCVTYEEET